MGRVKRGYVRDIPSDDLKRDYRLFAIACEGAKREREYFQQLEGISSRVVIEYIEDEEYRTDPPSSPNHVLRRAIQYVESNNLNEEDSVWLVMDVDKWGDKVLNEVQEECKKRQNWHTIISNPCFEVWLLYHTTNDISSLKTYTSKDCKTVLDEQTPKGYDPKRYIVLIKDALINAKNADKSKGWYPDCDNTKMYLLIEALMKYVSVKEFDTFIERFKE